MHGPLSYELLMVFSEVRMDAAVRSAVTAGALFKPRRSSHAIF